MKQNVIVIFLLHFVLVWGCKEKKKDEAKPLFKRKEIPGTDIHFANRDTAFMDTGNVITIRGRGFDPKMWNHYVLEIGNGRGTTDDTTADFPTIFYSFNPPQSPAKLISITDSEIKYKIDKYYLKGEGGGCSSVYLPLFFYKYSDERLHEMDEQYKYVIGAKKYYRFQDYFKIFRDTLYLKKGETESPLFILLTGIPPCFKIILDNKELGEFKCMGGGREPGFLYSTCIIDEMIKSLPDGYHTVKIQRKQDGREIKEVNKNYNIYIKNIE